MHELIRDAAARFLRGETSVVDFTYDFRNALDAVTPTRPLTGREVDLFYALEQWETPAGPIGRGWWTNSGRSPRRSQRADLSRMSDSLAFSRAWFAAVEC